ncbi:MAG: DUF2284 domain-containing protein [Clostridiaceae bacterium]|nr:DUF2284 domain-containing protein [Clostridiaceae bacterium]
MVKQDLVRLALEMQATHAAWINSSDIPFAPELRELCVQNSCGAYNSSWMGPPAIGPVEELMARVRSFSAGLVVQTVGQLEDSFDYPGMMEVKARHEALFSRIVAAIRGSVPAERFLALNVGCCHICETCSYPDEPCLRPDEAMASVEAYGIFVNGMLTACGLKYNNGPDTVSFVGLILFDGRDLVS